MRFRHVFFDVDSTLVTIEGIDILGAAHPEVAVLTEAAMNGEVPLDEVYARRLELIRPSREAVDQLAARYLDSIVDGAEETLRALHEAGAAVHLVTAGIEQAVLPLAGRLGVSARRLHAVALRFGAGGEYQDFDRQSPLTRAGGKGTVIRDVRARAHGRAAMVGDGASDLETKPAVELFIGFGGVHIRLRVKENADAFVTRLADVLPLLV
jgi:phosphoserine phosphatase